ncbi:MAG: VTT domain-containing protein [Candidatus Vogelbacteria bacterium]|nr:VTT domain-containing protein [Candidatus Vogelbacteria bacterium]
MIEMMITFIREVLWPLGAGGVLAAGFLEEVIAPIPSALVMLSAGFLFLTMPVSVSFVSTLILKLIIPITIGVVAGSMIYYYVGYVFGRPFIERYGCWLGVGWPDVERLDQRLQRSNRDELVLFSLRVFPLIPNIAINLGFGLARYHWRKFLVIILAGTAVRVFILAIIGSLAGNLYSTYADLINRFENGIFAILIISILIFSSYRLIKQYKLR